MAVTRATPPARHPMRVHLLPPMPVQVATLCVERGHMLALVWGALRHVLHAVLADRDTARTTAATARRMAAQAAQVKSTGIACLGITCDEQPVGSCKGRAGPRA